MKINGTRVGSIVTRNAQKEGSAKVGCCCPALGDFKKGIWGILSKAKGTWGEEFRDISVFLLFASGFFRN